MSMNRRRLLLRHEYNKYIHFEDKEVERICIENWDKDGDGKLSKEEAAAVSSIETIISQLKKRSSNAFQEFRFFTNVTIINVYLLSRCNLTKISLPQGIREIKHGCLSFNMLTELVIPSSCSRIEGSIVEGNTVDCNVIFQSPVPPNFHNNFFLNRYSSAKIVMYVPDEALTTYRNIPILSAYAKNIRPISEYKGNY